MKKLLVALLALGSISTFACNNLDKNVRAHTTTWTTLFSINELNINFMNSGEIYMKHLRLADLDIQSRSLIADQLDNILVEGRGAKHIGSKTMAEILEESINSNFTVCDFANELDLNYHFWGE